jgi:CRP-like cAMP-binding protein
MYAAFKLRQNMKDGIQKRLKERAAAAESKTTRAATMKKNKEGDLSRVKSVRTRKVEQIQKDHSDHRHSAIKDIQRRQTSSRHSVHSRVQARKKAKRLNSLQKSEVFSGVDSKSISKIVDTMDYVVEDSGAVICQQGDVATTLYLVMSGECSVDVNGSHVAVLSALDLFGENALFPGSNGSVAERSATVRVRSDTVELLTLSKHKFDRLMSSGTLNDGCLLKMNPISVLRAQAIKELFVTKTADVEKVVSPNVAEPTVASEKVAHAKQKIGKAGKN